VLVVVSQGSAREKGADAAGSGEAVAADAAAVRHCARRCACESTIIIIMQCSLMIDLTPVWLVRLCSDLLQEALQSQIAMLARDVRQLASNNNAVIQMDMGNGGGMSNSAALRYCFFCPHLFCYLTIQYSNPVLACIESSSFTKSTACEQIN